MPSGALDLQLTDMVGEPVRNIDIELSRFRGEPGTGGETMHVSLVGPDPNLEITGQAESESDAVSLLGAGDWDAVVLDLQLKQGTGLGVLKKLRLEGRASHTKVIVFTNYAFPQYRDRSLSFGADFFFDKAREFHRVRDVLADLASGPPPRLHS